MSTVIEQDLTRYIIDHNAARSQDYSDPAAQLARRLYRASHPTEILVTKCMDGRLNLSLFTNTPPGIIQPFRNIGGRFDLGWPFFQEVINDGIEYAIDRGRLCLVITSYHFAKGDHHRGCAGFGYDTEAAEASALRLREQFTIVYGATAQRPVYAITIGIETDEESIIFHGPDGAKLNVSTLPLTIDADQVDVLLRTLYPDMLEQMRQDLIPLILGNHAHIKSVKKAGKAPIDLEHREQIIAVGRGFDWLHQPNKALIIGPYSHDWDSAVKTAGTIVLGNLEAGRIPREHGILLVAATIWRNEEREVGRRLKIEKVRYLKAVAENILRTEVPALAPHLHVMAGIVEGNTRRLHTIT